MAHHKRRKPKSRRRGCLLCKPHKHERQNHRTNVRHSVKRLMLQQDGIDPITHNHTGLDLTTPMRIIFVGEK